MKPRKNQLKYAMMALLLCSSLLFLNSCQTSEDELVFNSEKLLTKDSKIVPLLLKAVGGNADAVSLKSTNDEQQCTHFKYPMTFYAYGSDAEEPYAVQINSDEELISFLTTLTSGQQFFITYPVTLIDVDGVETVITDYPDLEGILTMLVDACLGGDDDDDNDDDTDGDDTDGDDTDGDDTNGDDGDGDIQYEYCGNNNKKVVICHNGQSICISINAIWGHMAHHADDYYGSCKN